MDVPGLLGRRRAAACLKDLSGLGGGYITGC